MKNRSLRRFYSTWGPALRPGLGLKRWMLLGVVGITMTGIGLAFVVRTLISAHLWPRMFDVVTLHFLPEWMRGGLFLVVGLVLGLFALLRFSQTVLQTLSPHTPAPARGVVTALLQRQQRRMGPKIVAIGGGTGMPQLLRGLRAYTDNITAIVTVADDGGSSGRLRHEMGMLPPGDFRNNIAALSEAENLMTRLFQYRFADYDATRPGEQSSGLAGHSFGNLFITTMAAVTGSFETGIAESSRVLAVRGRVLPSTLEHVVLCAEVRVVGKDGQEEWKIVQGESNLPASGGQIVRVFLDPEQPRAYPEAVRAILQADLIVGSPGSFFTSLLPNLLVPSIRAAICASSAQRIYVCNVATQPGETDHYTVLDHVRQLQRHAGDAFPVVLANSRYDLDQPPSSYGEWVTLPPPGATTDVQIFSGDVVDEQLPWHHDSTKLAALVMDVFAQLISTRPSPLLASGDGLGTNQPNVPPKSNKDVTNVSV